MNESRNLKKSLKERALEMQAQLPLMKDREKGETDELIGTIVTINDFDFLTGDNGPYVVFTVKEEDSKFYFGGQVLTEKMKEFMDEGFQEAIKNDGLPIVLSVKKSRKGSRSYTAVTFYPEG